MPDRAILDGATIAFDLDGTLVDSAPDLIGAVNAILVSDGCAPLAFDQAHPFASRGARWLLQRGFAEAGVSDPPGRAAVVFSRFLTYYGLHVADESRPYTGVAEALRILKEVGARLVVCTNKPTDLSWSLLSRLGLADFFDAVVGSDAASAIKPAAAHLIEAVAAVGGNLRNTVMVGDADTDAGAARAAGTPLILVEFGYSDVPVVELAPDILLRHFDAAPRRRC